MRCTGILTVAAALLCLSLPVSASGHRLTLHRPAFLNASSQQVPASRPPRVYFLFMAVDKVSNLDVWRAFFRQVPTDRYRAFIHCKLPSCNAMVAGSPLVSVPTVPSYYCTDLVSPMNKLLAHALSVDAGPSHYADKFAFVSDSTLPAKPFSEIYATLSTRRGSDFCVFPSGEWADVPSPSGGLEIAVKHHQWITLERAHAETASALWSSGNNHDFMARFRMNLDQYTWSNNSFADSRNFGCLDEFWHMAALYGTFKHSDASQVQNVQLSLFTGGPLHVSHTAGWQGECDTFVIWSKYLHIVGRNPFEQLYSTLDYSSIPHGGNLARPGWWDTISSTGIKGIRKSSFLFVRKFIDNPRLADGGQFGETYARLVFGHA